MFNGQVTHHKRSIDEATKSDTDERRNVLRIPSDTVILNNKRTHTPSIAFRHLPPNSARFGYATEGALFISAQLSTDAVSALRKVRVLLIGLKSNLATKHARKYETLKEGCS